MTTTEIEQQHLQQQETVIQRIEAYYNDVLKKIAPIIASQAPRSAVLRKLDRLLSEAVMNITATIETGMQTSWDLSNQATNKRFNDKYTGIELPKHVQAALDDRRGGAARKFQKRREDGMDLSDRVWRQAKQVRRGIETQLEDGIYRGKSASSIARELRTSLLYDTEGPAIKSNTERLARTEINMSYRMADQLAYQVNPLVLGYQIELSKSGKPKIRCETCVKLAGKYPVDFVFKGWHPRCLCFKVPILMSRKMLDAYNKLIAQGKDTPEAYAKLVKRVLVTKTPDSLTEWLQANSERIAGWSKQPYWMLDNAKLVDKLRVVII